MSQQQQALPQGIQDVLQALPQDAQVNPQELFDLNRELNNGRISQEQIAKARRIIVGLLGAGLAIEAINNVFPGALGLFLINTVNTAWHMSSTGAIVLAREAGIQIADTGVFAVKTLLGLVTASMGLACNTYSTLKEYVTMSNVNYMLSFIIGRAVLQGSADIERYAKAFLHGEMDGVISEQLARVREGLMTMGSNAAQWTTGFQEAMASMGQRTVEGVLDRQMYLTEVNRSLSEALYEALQEYMEASGRRMSSGEAIAALWDLREDEPDQFEGLSPKLKFLYSVLHGIERVSNQPRNALGSYSVPESPEDRMLQHVDPDSRPDERMAPLYASAPPEFPEYGTRVRAPQCPPTQEQVEEAIETVTDMVSGRQFNPDNSETYDLITKNGFLKVVMMEPVNPRRSGNIFTAFTRLPVPVQENIIRGMYNDLPPDVDIERALTRENIDMWARRFRRAIMLSSDTSRSSASARTREDRSSDSDMSDKGTSSKASKLTAYSRGVAKKMPSQAFRSAASDDDYHPSASANASEMFSLTQADLDADLVAVQQRKGRKGGNRRTHKRRNHRRNVTKKGRKARRQTKRKNSKKGRKGRRQTKRR